MKALKSDGYSIQRLESKTAKAAIIQKIASDFNLNPIIAQAYYQQINTYFQQHAHVQLTTGQVCYEAVAADEPAGKHIALTRKVSCKLTLNDVNTDFEMLANYGLAGLRRHRLLRLTKQAYDQEALLSYEDSALLLMTSPSTVKRDIRYLKQEGACILTIRRSGHLGRIGEFMEMAADEGLACFSFTNTHGVGVLAAPYGGGESDGCPPIHLAVGLHCRREML